MHQKRKWLDVNWKWGQSLFWRPLEKNKKVVCDTHGCDEGVLLHRECKEEIERIRPKDATKDTR